MGDSCLRDVKIVGVLMEFVFVGLVSRKVLASDKLY